MAPVIADVVRVTVKGHQPAGNWANVFHLLDLGTATAPDDMAKALGTAFKANISPFMTAQWVCDSLDYVDLSSLDGDSGSVPPVGGGFPGQSGGFGSSPNVATLVRWNAPGGRANRTGRSYFGGVDEDLVDTAGDYTLTDQATIQGHVTAFLAACQTALIQPVILSRSGEGTYVPRSISDGVALRRCATQRRRLRP
jgi:hypothetical protein